MSWPGLVSSLKILRKPWLSALDQYWLSKDATEAFATNIGTVFSDRECFRPPPLSH